VTTGTPTPKPTPKGGVAATAATALNAATSTEGTVGDRAKTVTKAVTQEAAGKAAATAVVSGTGNAALGKAADKVVQVAVSDPKRTARWILAAVATLFIGVIGVPLAAGMLTAQAVGGVLASAAQHNNSVATETQCGATAVTATDADSPTFTASQSAAVDTIVAAGTNLGLPQYASVVAVATAIAASGLDPHYDSGDGGRGLFAMNPADGWGTTKQLADPTYAATVFFAGVPSAQLRGLTSNTTWARQPVSQAAFSVLPVDSKAVAAAEGDAQRLVAAALGTTSGYSCASNAISVDGEWFYPLPNSPLAVTSPFNPSRFNPVLHVVMPHNGTDFHATFGTPVYAVLGGTVQTKPNYGGAGNAILVTLADGNQMHYFHLSKFAVDDGATVQAGDLIGYVGSTGNSTGPHLHFEIVIGGTPVDPVPILAEHGITVAP